MIIQVLHCPHCQGTDIVRHGKSPEGKQRYRCRECREGRGRTFLLAYSYAGQSPEIKDQIVEMAMNAGGIRDTARVLKISTQTVMTELKKESELEQVNHAVLRLLNPEQVEVAICRADELEQRRGLSSELDEMWSFVRAKSNPRWLWHAIDHRSGQILAYVFGRRQDAVFLELKKLLELFGITRYYTDGWGAYERHLDPEQHRVGKDRTQKIESKHIKLRTRIKRLVRRTICFSKTERMHDLVIGLFINRYEFGRLL
ncbi:IS1 family transposase [Candidatus Entotheonella palauensis]|uniref:IS1 family transposase n=1 Tax=Candidatus Entotheonella palauensis TaxID=93172 RepID=UPI003FA4625A